MVTVVVKSRLRHRQMCLRLCPLTVDSLVYAEQRLRASKGQPLATHHSPLVLSSFFSFSSTLFCAFLHLPRSQPFCFQAIPHSLSKTPAGGGHCPCRVLRASRSVIPTSCYEY